MSREIKFRLIFDGKIVGYEKHSFDTACGILHSEDGKNWYNINVKNNLNKWIWHTTKEQYAGLKDCNGEEAYKSDLAKVKVGGFEYTREIYQAESGAWVINIPVIGDVSTDGVPIILYGQEFEIIGNIHEKEKHNG